MDTHSTTAKDWYLRIVSKVDFLIEFLEVVGGILQVHNLIEIDLCNDSGCLGVQWKNKNTR